MVDRSSLIAHTHPKSPISEAYRVLRTNIQFSSFDRPAKVILITSSGPGEGKTTTAGNLAITFAQSGSKTLLIDGDLRKPRMHKLFQLQGEAGLTNILAKHEDYSEYVHRSVQEHLDILTCGVIPPNPSELLSSNVMRELMLKLREDYDIVIIDSPPIGTVTDAAILSTIADGTILVAASAQVQIASIQRAKELLSKVNANILGVVLNKMTKNTQGHYYYYYYYYYYDEDNDKKGKRKQKRKKEKELRFPALKDPE